MAELHDLAAAYALDALDADERARFAQHLETCPPCQQELAVLIEGAAVLAETTAQEPPAHLKTRILERVASHPTATRPPEKSRVQSRRWQWAFAAAAGFALVFAALLLVVNERLDRAETITAVYGAGDSISISIDTPVGPAEFTFSQELGLGVFVERGLAEPAGDRVYELWLVGESGPAPAGIFRPGGDEVLVTDLVPGVVLAMTEEPAGGSDQPTGDILFTSEL